MASRNRMRTEMVSSFSARCLLGEEIQSNQTLERTGCCPKISFACCWNKDQQMALMLKVTSVSVFPVPSCSGGLAEAAGRSSQRPSALRQNRCLHTESEVASFACEIHRKVPEKSDVTSSLKAPSLQMLGVILNLLLLLPDFRVCRLRTAGGGSHPI